MKLHYEEKTTPEQRYSESVFRPADKKAYRFPTHAAKLVMDRLEAETSEAFLVMIDPGERRPCTCREWVRDSKTWWPPQSPVFRITSAFLTDRVEKKSKTSPLTPPVF